MTEPEAGSDASAMTLRAARDGDDYVLDGTKVFIKDLNGRPVPIVDHGRPIPELIA